MADLLDAIPDTVKECTHIDKDWDWDFINHVEVPRLKPIDRKCFSFSGVGFGEGHHATWGAAAPAPVAGAGLGGLLVFAVCMAVRFWRRRAWMN